VVITALTRNQLVRATWHVGSNPTFSAILYSIGIRFVRTTSLCQSHVVQDLELNTYKYTQNYPENILYAKVGVQDS
jgi:hypothetical protein